MKDYIFKKDGIYRCSILADTAAHAYIIINERGDYTADEIETFHIFTVEDERVTKLEKNLQQLKAHVGRIQQFQNDQMPLG